MNTSDWLQTLTLQLSELLPSLTGRPTLERVYGGDINTCYCLTWGRERFFVKTNSHAIAQYMFQQESRALKKLSECKALKIPRTIALGNHKQLHYLVLDFISFAKMENWQEMGEALANVHQLRANSFGWPSDNFIGTSHQLNTPKEQWHQFWWENRLSPQLNQCVQNGLIHEKEITSKLKELNTKILYNHHPQPSLLHGDLWAGNAAFDQLGTPCLYDPASYYGDCETDLALTELFGGFPNEFYSAYNKRNPVADEYALRKHWYNLYHLLNHANLFGGHYVTSSLNQITQVERLLS